MDGAAAVPMEREEGKANGSRVAAARVGCCVVCCLLVFLNYGKYRMYDPIFKVHTDYTDDDDDTDTF